jgi:hypothetical protein
MRPSDDRLREVFNRVEPYIEDRYGIPVIIKDVPAPFTGDLDGAEIHVDHAEDIEGAVFIVAHLFGHTVQWNTSPEARRVGLLGVVDQPDEQLLEDIRSYEETACRYSLQLFHNCGVPDLDQWLSDFAACDYAYLDHYYRTGDKQPFKSFWREGQALIQPLAIPEFTPTRWVSRWEGIVV